MSKIRRAIFLLCMMSFSTLSSEIQLLKKLIKLKRAYPTHIKAITATAVVWTDDTHMEFGDISCAKSDAERLANPSLAGQLMQPFYQQGPCQRNPINDPGRIRYEPFFRKMYGNSPEEVEQHLEKVVWMPRIFGNDHVLLVTRVNNVHEKVQQISAELEELVMQHPEYLMFLRNPGGTYCWRIIANTDRLSAHSFGMTLDINASYAHYWQWELAMQGRPIREDEPLDYLNTVPWEIVEIFEKQGFIWGGKWYHFDTMHFEYRPELID